MQPEDLGLQAGDESPPDSAARISRTFEGIEARPIRRNNRIGTWLSQSASLASDSETNTECLALARMRMAKCVLEAAQSLFLSMLQYKSDCAGVWFDEFDAAYSTQTCSYCKRHAGLKGQEGFGIREWVCPECGAHHHRDAAVNILAEGRRRQITK